MEARERHKQLSSVLRRSEDFKKKRRETRTKYREQESTYTRLRRQRIKDAAIFKNQKEVIKDFYAKCPKGMVVDHINPLMGEYVSGLHTISNLQYLTAQENSLKSRSFDGELDNTGWRKIKGSRVGK